jgi:hypothetical protein
MKVPSANKYPWDQGGQSSGEGLNSDGLNSKAFEQGNKMID